MPKILIALGLILIAAGLVWLFAERLGLGHLPGDISIKREWGTIYIPITTSVVISIVLSVCFWIVSKWSN
jgi:heme/copper-type cytochrome/quinol oxidase subunit 2